MAAGIAGHLICMRAGVSRAKLCGFERGYFELSSEELTRMQNALEDLIEAKRQVAATAARVGWPVSAL
jgi:hypothetical protein